MRKRATIKSDQQIIMTEILDTNLHKPYQQLTNFTLILKMNSNLILILMTTRTWTTTIPYYEFTLTTSTFIIQITNSTSTYLTIEPGVPGIYI